MHRAWSWLHAREGILGGSFFVLVGLTILADAVFQLDWGEIDRPANLPPATQRVLKLAMGAIFLGLGSLFVVCDLHLR